jgi:hypothetical protein
VARALVRVRLGRFVVPRRRHRLGPRRQRPYLHSQRAWRFGFAWQAHWMVAPGGQQHCMYCQRNGDPGCDAMVPGLRLVWVECC